jgi:hypothetical protein
MDLLSLAQSFSHAFTTIALDDSSVSVLAMLAGIIGGWTITGMRQPKPKKLKIDRKNDIPPSA